MDGGLQGREERRDGEVDHVDDGVDRPVDG